MSGFALVAAAAVSALPGEYHIDCSSWAGQGIVEFDVRITARDGSRASFTVEMRPCSNATHARDLILFQLKDGRWKTRTVEPGILIVEGAKRVPIRSVEFAGKDWKPTVRWAPLLPEKK